MLKDKNLIEDIDLVKELDNQVAEAISGGWMAPQGGLIQVKNNTKFDVVVDFKYGAQKLIDEVINHGKSIELVEIGADKATLDLDNNVCKGGIQFKRYELKPGNLYSLERKGNCLIKLVDKGLIV